MSFLFIRETIKYPNVEVIKFIDKIKDEGVKITNGKEFISTKFIKKAYDVFRLIFEKIIYPFNNEQIEYFVLVDIIRKDDKKYKAILSEYKEKNTVLSKEELEQFNKLIESKLNEQNKEPLPAEFYFLENIDFNYADVTVYETRYWVKLTQEDKFKTNWDLIRKALLDIVNGKVDKAHLESIEIIYKNEYTLKFYIYVKNDNIRIVYRQFQDGKILLFCYEFYPFEPLDKLKGKIYEQISETFKVKESELTSDTIDDFLKITAIRSYEGWIIEDASYAENNIWYKLETDADANLSFSDEEKKIIEFPPIPFFVNGQAGSGKSTILYYLFAYYYYLFKKENIRFEGVFLTYSNYLKERAKETISNILTKNHNYQIELSPNELDEYLFSFHDFLISYFDEEKQLTYYSNLDTKEKYNYISFDDFKRLYYNSNVRSFLKGNEFKGFHAKNYSAEFVWFVVRSYIKGYYIDKILTPEEYENIPKKDKIVNQEDYKTIYEKIYHQWYRWLSEKGFWDDLDLVKKFYNEVILNKKRNIRNYIVIFCDEAQDYTRAEIRLIMELSKFRYYQVGKKLKLPVAFGGDPSQTINPTGFNWKNVKSLFFNIFNETGLPVHLEAVDLTYNYRSTKKILALANFIQYIRTKYLNLSLNSLQIPYNSGIGTPPKLFIIDKTVDMGLLKKAEKENIILLIPTLDFEFIKRDTLLSQYYDVDNENIRLPRNILDVFSFKGSEADSVILYKFGDYFTNQNKEILKKLFEYNIILDENQIHQLYYIFNILYVAVTRAKNKLFIVDTENGFNNFWQILLNQFEEIIKINNEPFVGLILENLDNNYSLIEIPGERLEKFDIDTNVLELAQLFEEKGLKNNNFEDLFRAASYYYDAGEITKSNLCYARAYELKGEPVKAAQYYFKLNEKKEAIKIYWKFKAWKELIEQEYLISDDFDSLYVDLARFLMNKNVEQLNKILSNSVFYKELNFRDKNWREVFEIICEFLIDNFEKFESLIISEFLELIPSKPIYYYKYFIPLYFRLGDYTTVINLYDKRGEYKFEPYLESIYWKARAYSTENPQNKIKFLLHSRDTNISKDIYDIWKYNISNDDKFEILNQRDEYLINGILNALKKEKDFDEFLSLVIQMLNAKLSVDLSDLNRLIIENLDQIIGKNLIINILSYYIKSRNDELLINFYSKILHKNDNTLIKWFRDSLIYSLIKIDIDISRKLHYFLAFANGLPYFYYRIFSIVINPKSYGQKSLAETRIEAERIFKFLVKNLIEFTEEIQSGIVLDKQRFEQVFNKLIKYEDLIQQNIDFDINTLLDLDNENIELEEENSSQEKSRSREILQFLKEFYKPLNMNYERLEEFFRYLLQNKDELKIRDYYLRKIFESYFKSILNRFYFNRPENLDCILLFEVIKNISYNPFYISEIGKKIVTELANNEEKKQIAKALYEYINKEAERFEKENLQRTSTTSSSDENPAPTSETPDLSYYNDLLKLKEETKALFVEYVKRFSVSSSQNIKYEIENDTNLKATCFDWNINLYLNDEKKLSIVNTKIDAYIGIRLDNSEIITTTLKSYEKTDGSYIFPDINLKIDLADGAIKIFIAEESLDIKFENG